MIHIAIYHLSVQIISRSDGRSSIAAAAYRSGTKIESSWDGLTYDFTKKHWIEHSEILLPAHAPKEFSDRSVLWNAVESAEKSGNAQLAREVEIALPAELSLPKQIELIRSYVDHEFVSRGMCADISIHNPPRTNEHGAPVDCEGNKTKNRSDLSLIFPMVPCEPTMKTIIQEKSKTTIVLNAVARSESVFLMPHFASIDVSPAKTAERIAAIIQNIFLPQNSLFIKLLYQNFGCNSSYLLSKY